MLSRLGPGYDFPQRAGAIRMFATDETVKRRQAYVKMPLGTVLGGSFLEGQRRPAMRRMFFAFAFVPLILASSAFAGDAEVKAAQAAIDGQMKAFIADDGVAAYSFAAPNVKQIFPTVDTFMNMVTNGYPPVRKPQTYSFGKVEETSPTSIVQQVLIVGPDGKDYEAVYTLQQQPDGTFQITGCSLRASNSLST
jgi:hypothetical protein